MQVQEKNDYEFIFVNPEVLTEKYNPEDEYYDEDRVKYNPYADQLRDLIDLSYASNLEYCGITKEEAMNPTAETIEKVKEALDISSEKSR